MLKIQRIKLDKLAPNIGQIPGLPMNPRNWDDEDVERLAKSLRETPELFEARPIIAVPFDGKNVILGGNLRFEGAKRNGDADAPVVLLPADTPLEKMREIVIKDNGTFGKWDVDALLKEWDTGNLPDWGVPDCKSFHGEKMDIEGLFKPETERPNPAPKPITITLTFPADVDLEEVQRKIVVALEGIVYHLQ